MNAFRSCGRALAGAAGVAVFSESWIWIGLVAGGLKKGDFGAGTVIGSDAIPPIEMAAVEKFMGTGTGFVT